MPSKRGLSRRDFLRKGVVGFAGVSLLAACAPSQPAPKPDAAKPAADAKNA